VGGIVGYSLVWGGASAVTWYAPIARFPYMTGVSPLAVAWVVSPLAAGLTCCLLFLGLRAAVLRRAYSLNIAFCVSGKAAVSVWQSQLHA
jgi:phosphate/sulfate permease